MNYWVVEVQDPGDPVFGTPRYTVRHKFEGEDAPTLAWECWASATHHGFLATAEEVRRELEPA